MKLSHRYDQLAPTRNTYLNKARECALYTLPFLFPPEGNSEGTIYPTPWQSLGARCTTNLAAKLLLALFPPNSPFFKLSLDDFALEKLTAQKGMRGEVEKALNKIERAVITELEATASRPHLFEALKQLIVGGNALLIVGKNNKQRVIKLTNFVVKRDPSGNPLEIVTKECVSPLELRPEVRAAVQAAKPDKDLTAEKTVDVFTLWRLTDTGWESYQEIKDVRVPGSDGNFPKDKCPARPLRWSAIDGEDYGRGMVEEYLGDFKSLEGLQKAIVLGAAAASKVLFLVNPNGTTKKETLAKAPSGAIENGNAEDVTVLQMEKYNDFRVALEARNDLQRSLSMSFLLNSAVQRDGERVTAEEIRFMAQEIEAGLGGVYSTLSQDLQLPLVTILMSNMERDARLPTLPKGVVRPTIVTGIEAIGRGNDQNRIKGLLQDIAETIGPEGLAQWIHTGEVIKRLGVSRQVDMEGLVKTEDEVAQAMQQQQMAALAERAAPQVAGAIAPAMMQGQ